MEGCPVAVRLGFGAGGSSVITWTVETPAKENRTAKEKAAVAWNNTQHAFLSTSLCLKIALLPTRGKRATFTMVLGHHAHRRHSQASTRPLRKSLEHTGWSLRYIFCMRR